MDGPGKRRAADHAERGAWRGREGAPEARRGRDLSAEANEPDHAHTHARAHTRRNRASQRTSSTCRRRRHSRRRSPGRGVADASSGRRHPRRLRAQAASARTRRHNIRRRRSSKKARSEPRRCPPPPRRPRRRSRKVLPPRTSRTFWAAKIRTARTTMRLRRRRTVHRPLQSDNAPQARTTRRSTQRSNQRFPTFRVAWQRRRYLRVLKRAHAGAPEASISRQDLP